MKKRLLSLLLALCLFCMPLISQADSLDVNWKLHLNSEFWTSAVQSLAQMAGVDNISDDLVQDILRVIDLCTVKTQIQDNGIRLAFCMDDDEIADVTAVLDGNCILLTTSLLSDTVLEIPLSGVSAFLSQIASADWNGLAQDLAAAASDWYTALQSRIVSEDGSFAGDAYEGGTMRYTLDLTDTDLANLFDSLLLAAENHTDVMAMFDQMFGTGAVEKAFHSLRSKDMDVRETATAVYHISLVENESGAVGMSLYVDGGAYNETTVSVGVSEDTLEVVAKAADNDTALWWNGRLQVVAYSTEQISLQVNTAVYLSESSAVWADICGNTNALLENGTDTMDITAAGSVLTAEMTNTMRYGFTAEETTEIVRCMNFSEDIGTGKLGLSVSLSYSGQEIYTLSADGGSGDGFEYTVSDSSEMMDLTSADLDTASLKSGLMSGLLQTGLQAAAHLPLSLSISLVTEIMKLR